MKKFLSIVLSLILMLSAFVSFNSMTFAASKPASTQITSLTVGNKCITVKWTKKSVDGYQIAYSTSSSFNSSKKVTVKKGSTTSKTMLKSGLIKKAEIQKIIPLGVNIKA